MGEVIRIKCNDCNTEYDLHTGQGLRDNDPSNFISLFSDDRQKQIESIISSNTAWDFSRMPALCKTCGSFTCVPVFKTYDDEAYIRGICECGDDGDKAEIININEEEMPQCPRCSGTVTVSRTGLWD